MNTIIHPSQLEKATVRITCGDDTGSGFFVTENIVLTARHVIFNHFEEETIIEIHQPSEDGTLRLTAICIAQDQSLDIALLRLDTFSQGAEALPLKAIEPRYNSSWTSFGYPYANTLDGVSLKGTVEKTNNLKPYDIDLAYPKHEDRNYQGLSGSALVIGGRVGGVITWSVNNQFGAISIQKMADFLNAQSVPVLAEKPPEDLSDELQQLVNESSPNYRVLDILGEKIDQGGKYYLLHGSPGSGKTVLCATLQDFETDVKVLGRYFLKLPEDQRPKAQRAGVEQLLQWVEDTVSVELTGRTHPAQSGISNERIDQFRQSISTLNDRYSQANHVGVIIIDGLDEVALSGNINDFLGVFPAQLPSNLTLLLSATRKEVLPNDIKSQLDDKTLIHVTSLDSGQCEEIIRSRLEETETEITVEGLQYIAAKSEGHPLYLHYIIERIKSENPEDLSEWGTTLPAIGGDISKYYTELWESDIQEDADKLWIISTISQLRHPVGRGELMNMLPDVSKYSFPAKIPRLSHLLSSTDQIATYHSSFNLFVEGQVPEVLKSVNDHILMYCQSNPEVEYSISAIVYHSVKGSKPLNSLTFCNQEWADRCALHGVIPETVIDDIETTEILCIDHGRLGDFFRIKLLKQRIRFRYDQLLRENAFAVANALLAIGKGSEAINYVLREGQLVVNDDDTLFFLQLFYERGYMLEASRIQEAIDRRFRVLLKEQVDEGRIEFNTIVLRAGSTVLSANEDFDRAGIEYISFQQSLKGLASNLDSEQKSSFNNLREDLSAFYMAYFMWRYDRYPGLKAIADRTEGGISAEWAGHWAKISLHFHRFQTNAAYKEERSTYLSSLKDLVTLVQDHGYEDDDRQTIISALLEVSGSPVLVDSLIKEYLKSPFIFSLRDANGVDINNNAVLNQLNRSMFEGYVDSSDAYPSINRRHGQYEYFLSKALQHISFCLGKGYRLKAEGKLDRIPMVTEKVRGMLEQLHFSLSSRSRWDRSYSIPEQIVPTIYKQIMVYSSELDRIFIEDLLKDIVSRAGQQLGLYTEGYRRSLSSMADILSMHQDLKAQAFRLISLLESHTLKAAQNRWERTPELLKIMELYGRIGHKKKAMQIYQEVLNTSMGPTWYKEEQFALITTALDQPKVKDCGVNHFKTLAGYLDFASGELTFQLYVQDEIQGFIRAAVRSGYISRAIEYFKFMLLPEASEVIKNAESVTIDALSPGDSYIPGAAGIVEAGAMLSLLTDLEIDPRVALTLAELYVLNDDIFRHLHEYAEIQANALNQLEKSNSDTLESFFNTLVGIIQAEGLNHDRIVYLEELEKGLTPTNWALLLDKLNTIGIATQKNEDQSSARTNEEQPNNVQPETFFWGAINRTKVELDATNLTEARSQLLKGLRSEHDSHSAVWLGKNLSSEMGTAFELIPQLGTPVEIIQSMKELIVSRKYEDWVVVNKLIRLIQGGLDIDETQNVLTAITEHTQFMIRCPDDRIEKYDWLQKCDSGLDKDELAVNLLIWMLNHPNVKHKARVVNAIESLAKAMGNKVINLLLKETIIGSETMSSELSAFILMRLSHLIPMKIWSAINTSKSLKVQVPSVKHFMIRHYLIKMMENMTNLDTDAKLLYEALITQVPKTVVFAGDIVLNDNYLQPVERLLNYLNNLQILNKTFAIDFQAECVRLAAPLNFKNQQRAESYIERSFPPFEEVAFGSYEYLLLTAINNSITPRVDRKAYEEVVEILELPFLHEFVSN
jgi:hypothetical protein